MAEVRLSPKNYTNRELSWLEFNSRVLDQAVDESNPLFERMKFFSIFCSNLDEFFMIRVASIRDQMRAKYDQTDSANLTPKQQLAAISRRVHSLTEKLCKRYHEYLPLLHEAGVDILRADELSGAQRAYCEGYFESAIYPVLTPLAIDKSHPFPLIVNKAINLCVMLRAQEDDVLFLTVQMPGNYPRLVSLGGNAFVPIEDVVRLNVSRLFEGSEVLECAPYRITRNGDLNFDEEEAEDLLATIKKSLKQRRRGSIIRLEIEQGMSAKMLKFLQKQLEVERSEVYEYTVPINLGFFMKEVYSLPGFDELKYRSYEHFVPECLRSDESIFDIIRRGDILLYHPYDSFDPVIRLLNEAAEDPDVVAVKQTLYRVSKNSPVVAALERAAEKGKQVTALVELKARFDEENNIENGEELAKRGANVVYGIKKLKTHSKITLIVRRENGRVVQYLHLGTGNYNDVTARLYTDYSLLTCDEVLGSDAVEFFNSVTGVFRDPGLSKLIMAPHCMRSSFVKLIREQRQRARAGEGGAIFAKMNSLTDTGIIRELLRAAQAGVKIRLVVRGICCLRTDAPEACGNIEVRSIVGRFLEHSRVYIFGEGEEKKMFLSSADWMTRNLDKRVELLFPIEDEKCAQTVQMHMDICWRDNVKARRMAANGKYRKLASVAAPFCAQEALINYDYTAVCSEQEEQD